MMENVNYGREELLCLNLCRKGIIGDLLHAEAAYIHELRFQMEEQQREPVLGERIIIQRNGIFTPHGLGPVAQYMNLSRGEINLTQLFHSLLQPLGGSMLKKIMLKGISGII